MKFPTQAEIEKAVRLLPHATPEEAAEIARIIQTSSPAAFAMSASPPTNPWELAPHLAMINDHLVKMAEGDCPRLLVTLPPRHGKSFFISQWFPAWYLGVFPDRRVIMASYEADFAMSWGRKVRDVLEAEGERFFGIRVRKISSAADRWDIDSRAGGMQSVGVGGPLTGKGANILIIDDPVKNAEEANSQVYRDKTWAWYTSTAYTRLEPGGGLVLVQTRWHEDDLAGRILQQAKQTGEKWTVLNLPAIAEEGDLLGRQLGEALWPKRYSLEALLNIKKVQGSYYFSALYQQRPSPAEGGVYKRSWFRYARQEDGYIRLLGNGIVPDKFVSLRDCRRFGIADLAFTTKTSSDYTITSAWAVDQESNLILLDLDRDRLEGPDILPTIKRMGDKWDVDYFGVEANAAQIAVVQAGKRAGMTIRALYADKDKFTRAQAASVRFEGGQVFLPDGHDELGAYEHELLSFPNAAHDDMVDVTSWACAEVQRRGPAGESQSQKLVRELLEAEAAQKEQEEWMRIDNPMFWDGTVDA